jgi:hypothetical protein
MSLRLRISTPPDDIVTRVQAAIGPAIAPSPPDTTRDEPEVTMGESESVVSSESAALPSNEPYWVTDIEPSIPPPADEMPPSPLSAPEHQEEQSSSDQTSVESRLLLASFPLACSTILLVIYSLYPSTSLGWLIFGGLAWSGIIISAGIILKAIWDFLRTP